MTLVSNKTIIWIVSFILVIASKMVFGDPIPKKGPHCQKEMQFDDFPVNDIYKGPPKEVDLNSAPKDSALSPSTFRKRLLEGARKGPNFSGNYTVVSWGCGTGCQMNAVLNAKTGRIVNLDLQTEMGTEFKLNSSLLVANPPDPDYPPPVPPAVEYYKLENDQLHFICMKGVVKK